MLSFKEFLTELSCDPNRPVSKSELNELEKMLDRLWNRMGIDIEFTRHFHDRLNDARNKKQITLCELQKMFIDSFKRYAKIFQNQPGDLEAILKDIQTDVNVPFALRYSRRSNMLELVGLTVMRKKNFVSNKGEKIFKV